MDGNRLEKVEDDGAYRCKLVYGMDGSLRIKGIDDGRYRTFWEKRPLIFNREITSKMIGECIAIIKEVHSKTGKPPLRVISTSSDFCARRSDPLLEELDGNVCLVRTIVEPEESEESDIEYLLRMTSAQDSSNGVSIRGINYKASWAQLPSQPDEDKKTDILQKALRTGEIFGERYNVAPSMIVASLRKGSRLVRSIAE